MGGNVCKNYRKQHQNIFQNGSILDRVISQASNQDQCLLYKMANYKKGGELIDAYTIGGTARVEALIREQFGQLMYQDGKGQIINRSEYLRWKYRDDTHVILPIEASLSRYDPLAKWHDHEACWQMQYRGSLGESLLHVLIICDTKIHTRLARTLLRCFPKLALDIVEGEEYHGASALHLAIAYSNNELVQDLVDAGADVNQRACGSFFLPRDQQRLKPAKYTDYEGLAYLGEYPLAWAACCANESVYNLLLDIGADPDRQDNFGNMILHMVVVCDKLDMFGYALRHPKLPASNGIVNKAGLTPLTLACKLGRAEVFREMLELSAKEFWRYSNITCSAYFLNALDTLLPDGRTNWNSALFIILNGTKEEHLDMLDGGIIQRLLEEKWKTFARKQFLKRLLILVLHLVSLSLALYLRPDDPDEDLLGWSDDPQVISRYMAEIGTLAGVLSYLILQQGDEIRNQGFWAFFKQQCNSPPKLIFLVSNFMILACIPCRLYGNKLAEEAILVFAVPGSWFLLMFFAGAVRLTGPFVTMIYSMITGDMLTFAIIYIIVLFGFSQSFYFLYKGFPGVKNSLYNTYPTTWMALFQITLGNYDYQELSLTTYPGISKTVFALFMVFVPILLLNMLIAMMGNTYAHVIEQSEKEWVKQWAKIVIALERAIPQADAKHYLQEYSISLGSGEEPGTEKRGVLVIKSKSKTRAKQRKGAVANWKRVGKVTITALKKRGVTGEEMRCLMWGRESISTPVKNKKRPKMIRATGGTSLCDGFGDALNAALDVMTFAHDLELAGPTQYVEEKAPIEINPANKISIIGKDMSAYASLVDPSKNDKGSSVFGTLTQLTDSQGFTSDGQPIQTPTTIVTQPSDVQNEHDPLRQLVLKSDNDCDPEHLKCLAVSAANLPHSEEIVKSATTTTGNVKSVAGIFTGTEMFVRKIETTIKKKYDILNDRSDDDDGGKIGELPLLGRLSRLRRAKSANSRAIKNEKIKVETELSSSTDTTTDGSIDNDDNPNNFMEDRMKSIRESLKKDTMQAGRIRPINIDVALGENQLSLTISETLISQAPIDEKDKTNGIKKKRKLRAKTTKTNRVNPTLELTRNCRSANGAFNDSNDSNDSPDPLEPWSTKGISNMNKILAWQNDEDTA